jgi:hypothetical protein
LRKSRISRWRLVRGSMAQTICKGKAKVNANPRAVYLFVSTAV